MKRKVWLTVIVVAMCSAGAVVHHMQKLARKPKVSLSVEQVRAAVKASGGEQALQREAAAEISRSGNENGSSAFTITNAPSITKLASIVGGEIIDVTPADADGIGVPAHVLIRRGSHFSYQFIYVFGTASAPTTNNLTLEPVCEAIYIRNTAAGTTAH